MVIRLEATGTLLGELRTLDAPRRLYMDLAGVVPRVPRTIPVDRAGVHQVRVGLNSVQPAVTRLVVDLTQRGTFRLERGASDRELRLTVATTAAPMRTAAAAPETVAVAGARERGAGNLQPRRGRRRRTSRGLDRPPGASAVCSIAARR